MMQPITIRLKPDDLAVWNAQTTDAGFEPAAAARVVLLLFIKRLRANGNDYLEAAHTLHRALKPRVRVKAGRG